VIKLKKWDMTLQHKFVSYMIISTLLVMLSSYGLSLWVQSSFYDVTLPSEAILMQKIELAATATTPSQTAQIFPTQTIPSTPLTKGTVIVSTTVSPQNVGTLAAEGIQAIKVDVVTMSQRQYLMILALLMLFQFIGSMIWVRYMLVKPVHETVGKIDILTLGNYELEPCLDGKHELDHLNHQLFVLSEQLRQNKIYRESESTQRKSLIAGMSHDLKTPLTNILGYAETLTMEASIDPQQLKWLEIISRNAQLANRLIEDLLDLNRYDLRQYPVNKSLIHIDALIRECDLDFEDLLRQNDQHVALNPFINASGTLLKPHESTFETDKILLVRLVKNIFSNFHQHAGNHTTLSINATISAEALTLIFEDDGNGVAKEDVASLTDIFYVGDESRNKKGSSGLGLYNCQQIVTLLGGQLIIESDLGQGMKMRVVLNGNETK
jgi:signal transduction histidine kinase